MSHPSGVLGPRGRRDLPRGTVTLLFTDIEGSTDHLRVLRGDYGRLLADHAALLREASRRHGGIEVDTQGDAFFFVFPRAIDAVAATVDAQRTIAGHSWPQGARVRVRMGVHTGEPDTADDRYVGLDVHRAARICSAAHGGQVVLSRTTSALAAGELPDGTALKELGAFRLRGFHEAEALTQLDIAGLESGFPPLREPPEGEDAAAAADAIARGAVEPDREFELLLLGPVIARRNGRELPVTALKQRMILAALGLRTGAPVSADSLIDVLWGERPPPTAAKALQVYVSELRKLVEVDPRSPEVVVSQPPGYRLSIPPEAIDLRRFEQLWADGRAAMPADPASASRLLADALALWRGDPLADFRFEDAFAAEIHRLEETRIACVEDRLDADLASGEHAPVIPEIERLVAEHPLRERMVGQLMLALYRAGRQADALSAYQKARAHLVDTLGIDPSPELAALERRILQQDPALAAPGTEAAPQPSAEHARPRTLLVVSQSSRDLDGLTPLALAITRSGDDRECVLARVVSRIPDRDPTPRLREVTRVLVERRDALLAQGIRVRVAAFASGDPAVDLVKLAEQQDADLLVVDGSGTLIEGRFGVIDALLRDAACDVALHLPGDPADGGPAPIVVPFAGTEHDWAALELAALLAQSSRQLILAGVDRSDGGKDASRLLATASLVVQRIGDVIAEPVLVAPGAEGVIGIADGAHIIAGLSGRFREEGLGETRYQLARNAPGAVTFVRRGTRPGVLSPPESITRYTWSLAAG